MRIGHLADSRVPRKNFVIVELWAERTLLHGLDVSLTLDFLSIHSAFLVFRVQSILDRHSLLRHNRGRSGRPRHRRPIAPGQRSSVLSNGHLVDVWLEGAVSIDLFHFLDGLHLTPLILSLCLRVHQPFHSHRFRNFRLGLIGVNLRLEAALLLKVLLRLLHHFCCLIRSWPFHI